MLASIIPTRLSFDDTPLPYFIPSVWEESICVGSYVEIPWKQSITQGIVASIFHEKPPLDSTIKSIVSVLCQTPIVTPGTLSMIQHLSSRYCIPLHRMSEMFVPASFLSRSEKKNFSNIPPLPISTPRNPIQKLTIFEHISSLFSCLVQRLNTIIIFPDDLFIRSFFEQYCI